MSKSARLVSLTISLFFLLFSFSTPLYAAELTHPPVVESTSGPTSGVINTSYQFSTTASASDSWEIHSISLKWTTSSNPVPADMHNIATGAVGGTCTITSCTVTGSFIPTEPGTYYIFDYVYYNATGETSYYPCLSMSPTDYSTCQSSGNKFITFVVTDSAGNGTLPSAGILSNQTKNIYIGLGFIALGILATQTLRIKHILSTLSEKRIEKRKLKFEQKF